MTRPPRITPTWLQGVSKERRAAILSLAIFGITLSAFVIYQRFTLSSQPPVKEPTAASQPPPQPSQQAAPSSEPAAAEVEAARQPITTLRPPLAGSQRIVQPYGFGFSKTYGDYRLYPGIDYAAPIGATVAAGASGRVAGIEQGYADGVAVVIDHGGGLVTRYGSLGTPSVVKDATVKAGDPIGRIGKPAPGRASLGPHLHFEVRLNGDPVDPAPYFPN